MNRAAIALALTLALLCGPASAITEREMQRRLCKGWSQEVRLPSGKRVDCVNETHAIEVDWLRKFFEGVGQSLYYSAELKKKPGLILICKSKQSKCLGDSLALDKLTAYWRLPIDVWICGIDAVTLGDCTLSGPHAVCRQRTTD